MLAGMKVIEALLSIHSQGMYRAIMVAMFSDSLSSFLSLYAETIRRAVSS